MNKFKERQQTVNRAPLLRNIRKGSDQSVSRTTTKPCPTKYGWLYGSNYAIMFHHKPYANPAYDSLVMHSRFQARQKERVVLGSRQPM